MALGPMASGNRSNPLVLQRPLVLRWQRPRRPECGRHEKRTIRAEVRLVHVLPGNFDHANRLACDHLFFRGFGPLHP